MITYSQRPVPGGFHPADGPSKAVPERAGADVGTSGVGAQTRTAAGCASASLRGAQRAIGRRLLMPSAVGRVNDREAP